MDRHATTGLLTAIAIVVVILQHELPARSFFTGDSGVKLIAAKSAIAHPSRPADIDLPTIGTTPSPFMDPFFQIHGDHARAATSELFPIISAPFIALCGIRGAYVLPAAGFLLAICTIAWLGVELDPSRSRAFLVFVAAACTPLLFYGLEFWEHVVAVGVAALATALAVRGRAGWRFFTSGLLFGIAILLRPEVTAYCLGCLVAAVWLRERPSRSDALRWGIGLAVVCLPLAVACDLHSGSWLGSHISSNLAGLPDGWLNHRSEIAREWFAISGQRWLLALVFSTLVMVVVPSVRAHALVVAATCVAVIAALASDRFFPISSIFGAAPAALLGLLPLAGGGPQGRRCLITLVTITAILIFLSAPNDGGAQWGPRYLLLMLVPLPILLSDALSSVWRSWQPVGPATVVLLLGMSLLVQRNAYKELRSTKQTYLRVVDFIDHRTPANGYIATDVWWLDQVAAALYPARTFLFVESSERANRLLDAIRPLSEITIVRDLADSREGVFDRWLEPGNFSVEAVATWPDRDLSLMTLRRIRATKAE